jgi:hypothetical protein
MTEQDWINTIRNGCTSARVVRDGTMCVNGGWNYCTFARCPKKKRP